MRLRPAELSDAAAIARIEATGATPSWTEAAVLASLGQPTTLAIVAVDAGDEVLGHLVSAVVLDEAEILIVAVAPQARRRGLGRALLDAAALRWAERGVTRAFLDVRIDNAPALALYASAGWCRAGERRGYYADGTTAALMERPIAADAPPPSPVCEDGAPESSRGRPADQR